MAVGRSPSPTQNQNWERSDQPKDSLQRVELKQLRLQSFLSCAFGWSLSLPVLILSDQMLSVQLLS